MAHLDAQAHRPLFFSIYIRVVNSETPVIRLSDTSSYLSELETTLLVSPGGFTYNSSDIPTALIDLDLPKGPYFVSARTGDIYKAYRLYEDDHLAFWQGVIDDGDDGFLSLPASTEGLRLGVKDIFHIKVIATIGGSRAYHNLYGIQNHTALSVQRLLDLGAVLVGKMATSQFASGQRATADWIDFHAPFDPRGDGYQSSSGSSAGSGAGIGAYDWLDISAGSETGRSMRVLAGLNGVFGNRPSTGAISLEHVIPPTPAADTAGTFARSGSLWSKVTRLWYPDFDSNFTSYPKTLYRPVVTGSVSTELTALVEDFVDGLEAFLGVESTPANFTQLWTETRGDARPRRHQRATSLVVPHRIKLRPVAPLGQTVLRRLCRQIRRPRPYVNPAPLTAWQWAQANATEDVYAEALRNVSVFTNWYETEGYGRRNPELCSQSLYVYPWSVGTPQYRDIYVQPPTAFPIPFSDPIISVVSGSPEVIVPIREVPYNSTKTQHTEYLPVTMALRMARGCDHQLASLVGDLEREGILRPVAAGP